MTLAGYALLGAVGFLCVWGFWLFLEGIRDRRAIQRRIEATRRDISALEGADRFEGDGYEVVEYFVRPKDNNNHS